MAMKKRAWKSVSFIALLPVLAQVYGCIDRAPVQTITVSLRNTETYQYPTVGGDEAGARIARQAI